MREIEYVDAFYPTFPIGHEPQAIPCRLSIVEANGETYFKTPFAFVNAYGDDINRAFEHGQYYRTAEECHAYLDREYPNWKLASPIMDALSDGRHHYGDLVGAGRLSDRLGLGIDEIYKIARGHRSVNLKEVKRCLKTMKCHTSAV